MGINFDNIPDDVKQKALQVHTRFERYESGRIPNHPLVPQDRRGKIEYGEIPSAEEVPIALAVQELTRPDVLAAADAVLRGKDLLGKPNEAVRAARWDAAREKVVDYFTAIRPQVPEMTDKEFDQAVDRVMQGAKEVVEDRVSQADRNRDSVGLAMQRAREAERGGQDR